MTVIRTTKHKIAAAFIILLITYLSFNYLKFYTYNDTAEYHLYINHMNAEALTTSQQKIMEIRYNEAPYELVLSVDSFDFKAAAKRQLELGENLPADHINRLETVKKLSKQVSKTSKDLFPSQIGSSDEYAALFASLIKQQNMPVKLVGGHVFLTKEATYHVWAEVYLPEYGWVPVDPSTGRVGTDNRYVKLVEGRDYEAFKDQLEEMNIGIERVNW